jgi:hypothetical protein
MSITGGCQCGVVRYRAERLGRSGICHCRMCQKATGGLFGVFIGTEGFEWTRGTPSVFRSSNVAERLFCAACGTPLAFKENGWAVEIAVGTLDDPVAGAPVIEVNTEGKVPFFDTITHLPERPAAELSAHEAKKAGVVSYQHPDRDTDHWPPEAEK